jgi:hypothetical protein
MIIFAIAIKKYTLGMLLAAAFMQGHAKPDNKAEVSITSPPSHVQLGKPSLYPSPGWWKANVPYAGGSYLVTARAPHAVCSSVALTIPGAIEGQEEGGEYKVRINCVPAP